MTQCQYARLMRSPRGEFQSGGLLEDSSEKGTNGTGEGMYHVTKTWQAIEADTVILQKS
jgi:hypothetical protein